MPLEKSRAAQKEDEWWHEPFSVFQTNPQDIDATMDVDAALDVTLPEIGLFEVLVLDLAE